MYSVPDLPGVQTRANNRARISTSRWLQISPSHSSSPSNSLSLRWELYRLHHDAELTLSPSTPPAHPLRFSSTDRTDPGRCQLRVFATSRFGCFDLTSGSFTVAVAVVAALVAPLRLSRVAAVVLLLLFLLFTVNVNHYIRANRASDFVVDLPLLNILHLLHYSEQDYLDTASWLVSFGPSVWRGRTTPCRMPLCCLLSRVSPVRSLLWLLQAIPWTSAPSPLRTSSTVTLLDSRPLVLAPNPLTSFRSGFREVSVHVRC